jgi:hypothetical protein
MLRYGETRGIPRSSDPDFAAAQVQLLAMRHTTITADLVKGEAFAVNTGGEGPNAGVRGPIAEFEHVGLLADFRERATLVLSTCSER